MARDYWCPICHKVRFDDEHAAQVALVGAVIKRNRGKAQRRERRHYPCPAGNGWHLTSQAYDPKKGKR